MDDDFPFIQGQGSISTLRDGDGPEPRLWHMKSVSANAARALHKEPRERQRPAGFIRFKAQ